MWCFRGWVGGGRKLLSKALSCVCLVFFWLVFMATTVTAPLKTNVSWSVSSAVQEPVSTVELVALEEIARELKRYVELVTNNFSWIKVALLQFGVLFLIEILKIFTGVLTHYLVDLWRKTMPQWNSQMPRTLEDELKPVMVQLAANANEVVAALNWVATSTVDAGMQFTASPNEVVAALNRVAKSTEDLRAQLAAALNPKEEPNEERKVDSLGERLLEERLRAREVISKHDPKYYIRPPVETDEPL